MAYEWLSRVIWIIVCLNSDRAIRPTPAFRLLTTAPESRTSIEGCSNFRTWTVATRPRTCTTLMSIWWWSTSGWVRLSSQRYITFAGVCLGPPICRLSSLSSPSNSNPSRLLSNLCSYITSSHWCCWLFWGYSPTTSLASHSRSSLSGKGWFLWGLVQLQLELCYGVLPFTFGNVPRALRRLSLFQFLRSFSINSVAKTP